MSGASPLYTQELDTDDYPPSRGSRDAYHPGEMVGRYALRERVGVGGMGIVYKALDPELDRIVAVKLLLQDRGPRSRSSHSDGQRRLLREAQAMARLTHPNVVIVHDVGVHDDQVFVAMEFIEGKTLAAWRNEPHPVEEILRVFREAARGLQAAHDVGLVHRDFKPDNVMFGADGQIRVMDFGLARSTGVVPPESESEATVGKPALSLEQTLTQGLAGTPAYMAPEQHAGLEVTPKSDQFALCVALYETLYGERPFSGETATALAFAVLDGTVSPAPRAARLRVPAWLRKVLVRGLSVDPADRWPSMRALTTALKRRSRRTSWAIAGAAGFLALAWGATRADEPRPCVDSGKRMADVWDASAQALVRTGLGAHDGAWSDRTVAAVSLELDAYAQRWTQTSHSLCSEAQAGTLSPRLLDLGMACLRRRSNAMSSLVESLGEADLDLAQRAVSAVSALRPLAPCGDIHALVAEIDPPAPGAVALEVEAIRGQLASAETLVVAGRTADAQDRLQALKSRAAAVDYPAVQVEVDAALGVALAKAGQTAEARALLEEAFWRASALKHERVAAEIAVEMLALVGVGEGDFEAAEAWQRQAATAVARTGDRSVVAAALHRESANVALLRGDTEAAMRSLEEADQVLADLFPAGHSTRTAVSQNMALVMVKQGRFDDAAALLEPIVIATEKRLGPSHPAVAKVLANLGAAEIKRGRYAVAAVHLERAAALLEELGLPAQSGLALNNLSIVQRRLGDLDAAAKAGQSAVKAFSRAHGEHHLRYAAGLFNLGNVEAQRGNVERSTLLYVESLSIREEALGLDHPSLAFPLAGIGANHQQLGDLKSAETHFRRVLKILSAGPTNAPMGRALGNLAGAVFEQGRHAEARALGQRALTTAQAQLGPGHVQTATALTLMARIDAAAGNGAEAVAAAQEAVSIQERAGDRGRLLDAHFALAQGLWTRADPGDRTRALALATETGDGFEDLGGGFTRVVGEVRGWAAERRAPDGQR